jgi:hypothetical protein
MRLHHSFLHFVASDLASLPQAEGRPSEVAHTWYEKLRDYARVRGAEAHYRSDSRPRAQPNEGAASEGERDGVHELRRAGAIIGDPLRASADPNSTGRIYKMGSRELHRRRGQLPELQGHRGRPERLETFGAHSRKC